MSKRVVRTSLRPSSDRRDLRAATTAAGALASEPLAEIEAVLLGREVSAISFVRDYVEVLFDGPILRAISNPRGRFEDCTWQFPEDSALLVMRSYIGLEVTGVGLREDECFELRLEGGHRFVVPLDPESRVGPEALHLVGCDERGVPDNRKFWIW